MNERSTADAPARARSEAWPTIEVAPDRPLTVGRSGDCDVVIAHASISRRHVRLKQTGDILSIEDLDSRFGTHVNGVRVRRVHLHVGDVVRFGSSPPYRFDGDKLVVEFDALGMSLEMEDATVRRGRRTLLERITLSIPAGTFVGVLGPSGAGKSLLLGCLSSTITPSAGSITFDNELPVAEHLDYFRSKIGIVTQDDVVYPYLTVTENLRFAARLRRPALERADTAELIDSTLDAVGLIDDRYKRVAVLSGGQRKRLSVAIELLTRPRLILLDEPTSGLDPGLQARVMEMLRALTRRGITVVCSTHTMDTLHYFDRVAVIGLSDGVGTLVFSGPPTDLLPRFGVRTPADLFDSLLSTESLKSLDAMPATEEPDEPGTGTWAKAHLDAYSTLAPQQARAGDASFSGQAAIVLTRSLLGFWRDRASTSLALLQPLVLALLVVLSQHSQSRSAFVHFFLVVSILWLGMTLTVREIVRERGLYVRDRLACLKPDAYLLGKLVYAAGLVFVQALILFGTARLLVPLLIQGQLARCDLLNTPLLLDLLVLFTVGFGGAMIGLLLSALSKTERAAVALLPLALLPQLLMSRVAYGHGGETWGFSSPFAPVVQIDSYVRSEYYGRTGTVVMVASLPLLTRPATVVLDMPRSERGTLLARLPLILAAEWAYLILLLMSYLLILYCAFQWTERRWQGQR